MAAADQSTRLIAELATLAWRLRRRFGDDLAVEAHERLRRAFRDVEAMIELLREHTVEIQDHTGDAYDASLSLHVAAFQPTPGVSDERIVETLKPTVYRGPERIQTGEVIVAIPEREGR